METDSADTRNFYLVFLKQNKEIKRKISKRVLHGVQMLANKQTNKKSASLTVVEVAISLIICQCIRFWVIGIICVH